MIMSLALEINKDRKVGEKLIGLNDNELDNSIVVRNDEKFLNYAVSDIENVSIVNINKKSKKSDFVIISVEEFKMISSLFGG